MSRSDKTRLKWDVRVVEDADPYRLFCPIKVSNYPYKLRFGDMDNFLKMWYYIRE